MGHSPIEILAQCHSGAACRTRWPDDAALVAELRASWVQQYADYLGRPEAQRLVASLERSGDVFRHDPSATFVAWAGGRRVGVAASRCLGGLSLITLLEVVPTHRGRGIGTRLLRALQGDGAALMAHVSIHRPAVRALYLAAGFAPLRRTVVEHRGHELPFDVLARAGDVGGDVSRLNA